MKSKSQERRVDSMSQSPVLGSKKPATMTFPEAVSAIAGGKTVRREEWADKDEYCLLKDNFLMIHRNNKFHNWIVSEGDMLGMDWVIVK